MVQKIFQQIKSFWIRKFLIDKKSTLLILVEQFIQQAATNDANNWLLIAAILKHLVYLLNLRIWPLVLLNIVLRPYLIDYSNNLAIFTFAISHHIIKYHLHYMFLVSTI